ncbi:MAG TPA: carboxypeptidase-like regulatory domain-containing protein [Bryobacterales bacterium]|jgi:hypothetical protein|nr:carboxypeptidase-like regulatory domain-containing protein [Bryobacterales bacterium]
MTGELRVRTRRRLALLVYWMPLLLSSILGAESLGTISGIVTNADTGAALAGSAVVLTQADGSPVRTVLTDRQGRYVFDQLPPGYYLVKASRANFATGRYGQKSWDRVGRPIALGAGAGFSAEIRLHRLGAITGWVVDENGEGIPDFTVNAITAEPHAISGHVLFSAVTDDRGYFRIPGLQPGRYYVATAPRELPDGTGLLPTYYPKTLEMAEARVVNVTIGRETENIQIQPIAGALLHFSGIVGGAPRFPHSRANITLFRDEEKRETTAGAFGQFAFGGLVPGRYTLVAELDAPQGKLCAYQPLEIHGDQEGYTLSLTPAPQVSVRVVDEKGVEQNDPQILVFLSRVENGARTQPIRLEFRQGVYSSPGLMPGGWRFFVICPESAVVDDITLDGKEALSGFVLPPNRRASAVIRIRRDAGRVHGRVTDSSGQPARGVSIICYPLDPQNRYRLGGLRSQKTNLLGEYRFGGLPEGDYLIFSTEVEDFQPDDQIDALKAEIASVHVTRGANLVYDARVRE